MNTLVRIVLFGAALLWLCGWAFDNTIKYVQASELDFQFGNPAFSGNGYGTHVLSVDQLQTQRKKDQEDKAKSAASAAKRELNNTTIAKFVKNVESRIYANLSKQLVDNMFGVSCDSETTTCATSGTADVEASSLYWVKDTSTGNITLTITDENGAVTTMTVPVGDFVF